MRSNPGMRMNHPILLALTAAVLALQAVTAVAEGDVDRGREIAAACSACHGPDGSSPSPTFPVLGGQHQEYLVQALLGYQAGTRADSIMGGAVRTLTRQQLEDVAAYFASQKGLAGGLKSSPSGSANAGQPAPVAGGGMTAALSTIAAAGALSEIKAPPPTPVELAGCPQGGSTTRDRDGDGLADAFD
ncbi:MAG: c-type cytochrome, partial [Gammaproteobacteria bacterium]